jgi:hypothetical protein
MPTRRHVYVAQSLDGGRTYGEPVAVNSRGQRIRARAEDRPVIAVDGRGRVHVTYAADARQPWTAYYTVSTDGGRTFATPEPVSDRAEEAKHYQTTVTVDREGRAYLLWNDERGGGPGLEEASLYCAVVQGPGSPRSPARRIAGGVCPCCRIAVDIGAEGLPIVLTRSVLPGGVRDHTMLELPPAGPVIRPWRVSFDDWESDACPHHGPALAIADSGRYHIVWFTQGERARGLRYAFSDDRGRMFSTPIAVGDPGALAGHADVLASAGRVMLVWKEFDGTRARVMMMQSLDGGASWSPSAVVARSGSASDHPFLIAHGGAIFLSWSTWDEGHRLVPLAGAGS